MFIKSMVIDGFKSYGQRTDINGFDPLFNAITGLNGSGKSNILDAICFLLGITNLSQVRANNLQELVYKNGQAGINKASVSMTFDNTEKQRSPLGYEQYDELTVTRQIVIGGRNKYLINGCNASNTRVQDLFRSVQLNVNNPHFLIMQGRITKVLNMKPPEILSMLEEAAGTRMYESKKLAAQKTIEKKDSKLKEIDSVLNEEITPTLTKLKAERQTYVDYTKIVRELEHLKKIYIAWQFTQTQELSLKSKENMKSIKNTIAVRQEHTQEIKEKIKQLDAQIKEMEMKKDEESGGNLAVLEDRLKELQMTETKITSQLSVKKDVFKEETKKMKELQKNSEEDKLSVVSKEKELQNLCLQLKSLEEASHKDSEDVIVAQKHFQAVSAGLSSNAEGEAATLADQLITAKSDISQAETETKQAEMKLKHAKEEIVKKKRECSSTSDSYMKDEALYHELEKVVAKLQVEIKRLNFDEGKEEKLIHERRQLLKEVDQLKYKIDTLSSMIPNLTFNYSDPEKNFDRRKVHGLVCQLIKVKDPSTSRALEVTAGGKMYNVVVDTEVTAKKILEKGQLRRRYTIIPLNKIIGRTIDGATVQKAERLVGCENVHTALSLVGYEKEVESAMQYVFGGSFVCTDMNRAKEVTFGKGIMTKAVTLDGEVFDPAGTLSGGAMPQSGSILLQLSQIKETESDLHEKQQLLKKLDQEILKMKSVSERYHALKLQYELKERELELLKTRLQQSTHHQQLEEVKALQQSIEEQEAAVTKCIDMKKKAQERVQELQSMITNSKSIRERELKAAEKSLNDSKKRAEASKKQTKEIKQLVDSLNLETSEIQKGMLHYEEQLKTIQDSLADHETNIKEFSNQLTDIKASVANAIQEVQTHKALLKAQSVQIVKLQNEMESLMKDQNNTKLQIQQLEYDVSKCEKECKDALLKVEDFLSTYRWIKEERKFFGAPNTDYDFSTNDPKDAARRIKKLEESKAKLSKNVNMRAQNMMSKAEDQYQDLLRKKRIVENDKAKIASVIRELDEKKNLALKDAWEKVNKDFGSIFKTLLPGTKARLVPPEGMTVLEGLEFRVAFGDIWKESLSELSGGQRSLVALSLILALLLFKPAPIYILDEVDAALDISHTQNIGQMLRAHFKHSQFIIVSLKDGMFNNANVLFKTKFVDGMSTVSHHSQLKSSAAGTSRGVKSS